jgi:hypothetical protein
MGGGGGGGGGLATGETGKDVSRLMGFLLLSFLSFLIPGLTGRPAGPASNRV